MDETYSARAAALSIANGTALAKMLRAHGHESHADAIEAALSQVADIVSTELGRDTLLDAVDWVNEQMVTDETGEAQPTRH